MIGRIWSAFIASLKYGVAWAKAVPKDAYDAGERISWIVGYLFEIPVWLCFPLTFVLGALKAMILYAISDGPEGGS